MSIFKLKRPLIPSAIGCLAISAAVLTYSATAALILALCAASTLVVSLIYKNSREMAVIFAVCLVVSLMAFLRFEINIKAVPNGSTELNADFTVLDFDMSQNDNAVYTVSTVADTKYFAKGEKIRLYSYEKLLSPGEHFTADIVFSAVKKEYRSMNYANEIFASGYIKKVYNVSKSYTMEARYARLRQQITATLFSYMSPEAASTVNALTIGERAYQSNELYTAVARCGVSHIMVVSGMHMAVICGSVFKFLKRFINRRISAVLTVFCVVFFMGLCGFTPSVVRAGITYFIMMAAVLLFNKPDPLNSLCAAVVIMLIINPFYVGSVAFVLSVTSTAGIIILSPHITEIIITAFRVHIKPIKVLIENFSVTFSALVFTFPLTVYYFGGISLVAIPVNLLISQSVTFSLIFASVALVIAIPGYMVFASGFFALCEVCTIYFIRIIEFFGSLPWAFVTVDNKVAVMYVLTVAFFVIIKYTYNRIKRAGEVNVGGIRTDTQKKP